MMSKRLFRLVEILVAVAILAPLGHLQAADPPQAPALSTLMPVDDLVDQVEFYVQELEECLEDEAEFDDSVDKVQRCANSLAAIALAIGLHDQDSPLRKATPVLIKACQELAVAKDHATAKVGVAAVKSALAANGDPSKLKWGKVANLRCLMLEVPLINTRMKTYMRRFERGAPSLEGKSAALVAISQASLANADETEAPDKVAEWYKYCTDMRSAAGALNKAAHAKNEEAAKTAMDALQKSCDDCHAVFHKTME